MTLREEKPLQTPALVSHKIPRTQWGGAKQVCGRSRSGRARACPLPLASAVEFGQLCP